MDNYEAFIKKINKLTNIDLSYYKEKQMKRRITSLMTRNSFNNFNDYYNALVQNKNLLDEFINFITINVSEFYRNPNQWEVLEKLIIPKYIKNNDALPNIWSCACSTGEEPYSMVMLLTKFFEIDKIKILASDIDMEVIEKAKKGVYTEKSLDNLPNKFKNDFFHKDGNQYIIDNKIKNCVKFKKMDLLKDDYPKNIDLLICRNVMIYFTEKAKELLYKKFYDCLSNNGVLFVGSTEQIILPDRYNLEPLKTFFYKKIV